MSSFRHVVKRMICARSIFQSACTSSFAAMEQSSFIATRLASPSHAQVILGLSILYVGEFLRVYLGPVLSGGLSTLGRVISPAVPFLAPQSAAVEPLHGERIPDTEEIIRDAHKSQKEDRKASRGSENDLYMLKTHGYNKYRFLSPSFIKRNNLKAKDDK